MSTQRTLGLKTDESLFKDLNKHRDFCSRHSSLIAACHLVSLIKYLERRQAGEGDLSNEEGTKYKQFTSIDPLQERENIRTGLALARVIRDEKKKGKELDLVKTR